jgi:hypothetical protein
MRLPRLLDLPLDWLVWAFAAVLLAVLLVLPLVDACEAGGKLQLQSFQVYNGRQAHTLLGNLAAERV